jgi:regulator of sigma D
MYIEKLINSSNIQEDFNKLSDSEKVSLYDELDKEKESLKNQLIRNETIATNLENEKNEIMDFLKTNANINSIDELNLEINKLSEALTTQIKDFVNLYNSSNSNNL